jgi:hypothetical protein
VNQIRNLDEIVGVAAAGFSDSSLWEEAKKKDPDAIKRMIDKALEGTSVTVVFIGAQTAGRQFINYEIEQSIKRGNGLVGVQIHHLKDKGGNTDSVGITPAKLTAYKIYKYTNAADLKKWIEEAAKAAGK